MTVHVNVNGLDNIKRAMKNKYVAYVGILGSKATEEHENSDYTNAQIGAVHEFGSISNNIPARSFIRMPLEAEMGKWIAKEGKRYFNDAVNGNLQHFFTRVGLKAEEIIQDAFVTRGFGQWAENKPATIARKGSSMPLIDTGALRASISSEVVNENS